MSIPEKCPVCGDKMEKGYFVSGEWSTWSEKRFPKVRKLDDGTVAIFFKHAITSWGASMREAYKCQNCDTIIIPSRTKRKKRKPAKEG